MYAIEVAGNEAIDDFTFDKSRGSSCREFWYWRKNNALHAWMEQLYKSKEGTEKFNCVNVRLTKGDLLALQSDILLDKLKPASGFFWGNMEYNPDRKQQDLEFVTAALVSIEAGRAIYYTSWW